MIHIQYLYIIHRKLRTICVQVISMKHYAPHHNAVPLTKIWPWSINDLDPIPLTLTPEHDILMTNKRSLSKRVQRLLACGQMASQTDITFISSSTQFWDCSAHAFLMHWFTYKSLSAQFFFSWDMREYLHPVFDEFLGQFFSSVMSPQSSTPSQIQSGWIHTPLLHWSFFWQPKCNAYTVLQPNHSFSCSWIVRNTHVHLWEYTLHKTKKLLLNEQMKALILDESFFRR